MTFEIYHYSKPDALIYRLGLIAAISSLISAGRALECLSTCLVDSQHYMPPPNRRRQTEARIESRIYQGANALTWTMIPSTCILRISSEQ